MSNVWRVAREVPRRRTDRADGDEAAGAGEDIVGAEAVGEGMFGIDGVIELGPAK